MKRLTWLMATGICLWGFASWGQGTVEGTVKNIFNQPITNVSVYARPAFSSIPFYIGVSDAAGTYRISGIPGGSYALFTQTGTDNPYLDEWYNDVPGEPFSQPDGVTLVTVVNQATNSGINFVLDQGGGLLGLVTNDAGDTLTGVEVTAFNSNQVNQGSVYTDTVGIYQFEKLRSGTYTLRAQSLGTPYLAEWYEGVTAIQGSQLPPPEATGVIVTQGNVRTGISFGLTEGGQISGSVSNHLGQALPGISLQVFNQSGQQIGSGFSSFDGSYSVQGLFPGPVFIGTSAGAQNFINLWYGGEPRALATTGGVPVIVETSAQTSGVHFVLSPGAVLQCTVKDEADGALSGVNVWLYRRPDVLFKSALTFLDGRVTIKGLPSGEFYLLTDTASVRAEWYQDLPVLVGERVPGGSEPIWLQINQTSTVTVVLDRAGAISGAIEDQAGHSLTGIPVTLINGDGVWLGQTNSGSEGNFRFGGLSDHAYFLQAGGADVSGTGYRLTWYGGEDASHTPGPAGQAIALARGESVSNLQFALANGAGITGTVTIGGGPALAGEAVRVYSATTGLAVAEATTDGNGAYRISGLAPGNYLIRTAVDGDAGLADEWYPGIAVTSSVPDGAGVLAITGLVGDLSAHFSIEPGVLLSGRVTGHGQPIGEVALDLLDAAGQAFRTNLLTDPEGYFIIQGIGTGSYYLRTREEQGFVNEWYQGVPVTSTVVGVGASLISVQQPYALTNLIFDLASGHSVTARVVNAQDDPIAGAFVAACTETGETLARATTDSNGFVVVRGLPPMHVYLRAEALPAPYQHTWFSNAPALYATVPAEAVAIHAASGVSGIHSITVAAAEVSITDTRKGTTFYWNGEAGRTYLVESVLNLGEPWSIAPYGGATSERPRLISDTGGEVSYQIPGTSTSKTQFLRIRLAD
ncbi:MAG: carboxypeptidase regulatory-like domain-containing protein [Verrucomicrobia bacterium]|nr:carboxypeptidase regulatory-like domain-containing protein [Verrucomicrobiota bacterium]